MKKSIQENITLLSPTHIIIAPIQINYDNDEDAANPVEINLPYNGVIYQSNHSYTYNDFPYHLEKKP